MKNTFFISAVCYLTLLERIAANVPPLYVLVHIYMYSKFENFDIYWLKIKDKCLFEIV